MPATMTPTNNIIDLITTEANQKPRTWRGVSSPPPAAAAAVSSLSLLDHRQDYATHLSSRDHQQ